MERLFRGKTSAVTIKIKLGKASWLGCYVSRKEDLCMVENQQIRKYKIFSLQMFCHTQYLKVKLKFNCEEQNCTVFTACVEFTVIN